MREAHAHGAASVASQLRIFLREPARVRPRYLHGLEPLPPGDVVFKFAQGKFPNALLRDLARDDLACVQEAALAFIRQVCFWEGATHYQMLALPVDARREAIKENYRLLMALIHPDRQDASTDTWPESFAQRLNRAYAALGDDVTRHDYDAALRLMEAGSLFAPEAVTTASPDAGGERRRRDRAGLRFAKALLILTTVIATLLLAEVWVSEESGNYSVFHGAFTGSRSRVAAATVEGPRFLGLWSAPEAAVSTASAGTDPLRVLAAPATPARNVKEPDREPPPVAVAPTPAPELKRAETLAIAQAAAAPPEAAPAPAPVPVAAKKSAPVLLSSEAIEVTVARLVGYYEAGETDKLMSLIDPSEAGFWQTLRTRETYADFFRSTRQRKLRVNKLAWNTSEATAHATGEATVVAEYFDAPGTLERRVAVEMDIALRGGQPRITRLSLYPNSP